ncbi:MAG: hypothetical protein A3B81_03470 [Candidatus Muproteobacteria bacterium RIFCSPHIGHO2_02_FULL_65_16]|uniref:Type 4 fimbrial biogenesis protein PilX N-terminal domain-containing protein n=1 Tax=Candidatus Muproteobacteria bacterium RIFCSPHIGHO2_02_FULL_65_16 TaxID=1817766 RepID=A0A1F6U2U8_9PROT|nr:MAG: hypothetical protein A3B81_03470 [Candidatus Muproteobacteria bacterium RIFCSPHIGHO2_02_FULL_65_16]
MIHATLQRKRPGITPQRGAALLMSLVILVALTLITLASLGTSIMQLRMSSNEEMRASAQQAAQSGIDAVIVTNAAITDSSAKFFKITGSIGDTNCYNWPTSCTTAGVTLPTSLSENRIRITRLSNPGYDRSSSKCEKMAQYQIESDYDKASVGRGKAELAQGFNLCVAFVTEDRPAPPKTTDHN